MIAAICFGTLGPTSRLAAELGITSSAFAAWRGVITAIILAAATTVLVLRGAPLLRLRDLDRRTRIALVIAGSTNVVLNLAIFAAFTRISIALALVGFYTFPAMVAVLAVALGRESLGPARLAALLVALGGMVLVVSGGGIDAGSFEVIGFGLALTAAAAQTVYLTISKSEYREVPVYEVGLIAAAVAATAMATVAVLADGFGAITLPLSTSGLWGPLLWAGIVAGGLPFILLLSGIRIVGSTNAGVLMLFEPLTGVVLAAALLDESLSGIQLVGGAMILLAAVLLQRGATPQVDDRAGVQMA